MIEGASFGRFSGAEPTAAPARTPTRPPIQDTLVGRPGGGAGRSGDIRESGSKDSLKAVAKQFEAIFARQMIGSMRTAKLGDDLFGSDAGDQFRDMADARLAETMADKGTFGIAEMLVKQFGAKAPAPAATDATK